MGGRYISKSGTNSIVILIDLERGILAVMVRCLHTLAIYCIYLNKLIWSAWTNVIFSEMICMSCYLWFYILLYLFSQYKDTERWEIKGEKKQKILLRCWAIAHQQNSFSVDQFCSDEHCSLRESCLMCQSKISVQLACILVTVHLIYISSIFIKSFSRSLCHVDGVILEETTGEKCFMCWR